MSDLHAVHLGAVEYARGLELQEAAVRARAAGDLPDTVLYPDHPPVLTVGRSPSEGALRADGVFVAREVLAKHDENYMPPEVAKAIKEAGQWKDKK